MAFWCGAAHRAICKTDQRVAGAAAGAGAGFGNAELAAGAAAGLGGFGFFGLGLRTFGGGAVGFSSANTGLGSTVVVAGLV